MCHFSSLRLYRCCCFLVCCSNDSARLLAYNIPINLIQQLESFFSLFNWITQFFGSNETIICCLNVLSSGGFVCVVMVVGFVDPIISESRATLYLWILDTLTMNFSFYILLLPSHSLIAAAIFFFAFVLPQNLIYDSLCVACARQHGTMGNSVEREQHNLGNKNGIFEKLAGRLVMYHWFFSSAFLVFLCFVRFFSLPYRFRVCVCVWVCVCVYSHLNHLFLFLSSFLVFYIPHSRWFYFTSRKIFFHFSLSLSLTHFMYYLCKSSGAGKKRKLLPSSSAGLLSVYFFLFCPPRVYQLHRKLTPDRKKRTKCCEGKVHCTIRRGEW